MMEQDRRRYLDIYCENHTYGPPTMQPSMHLTFSHLVVVIFFPVLPQLRCTLQTCLMLSDSLFSTIRRLDSAQINQSHAVSSCSITIESYSVVSHHGLNLATHVNATYARHCGSNKLYYVTQREGEGRCVPSTPTVSSHVA